MLGPVKLSEISNLKPLPLSAVRLAELSANRSSEIEEFTHVIKYDQALTAQVLRWANSAWSQSQSNIYDLQTAIVRLGTGTLLKLVLSHHLMDPLSKPCPGYQLMENELWHHSVGAALVVEHLPNFVKPPIPPAAFAAALMHDLGKLILGRHLGHEAVGQQITNKMLNENISYIASERALLGTDHAEVGAVIAETWKLPEALVKAIANHHQPELAPEPVTDVVHVANAISKLIGLGLGIEGMNMEVSSKAALRIGLKSDQIQALCALVKDDLDNTQTFFLPQH
ncbi:MAG: HDOD domain-containing protein [Candidatus Firestonebacteria bacterium]|nr:HDOD domain-containing protein [Candidatus Firestonebacteria bacterium]